MMRRKQEKASLEIITHSARRYVEVVATTGVVTHPFLNELMDAVEKAVNAAPDPFVRVLLEVRAPREKIDLIQAFELWRRASERGIRRTQIAYVVAGRPIGAIARLMETVAQNRGILLRFFEDRERALAWLDPGASVKALHGSQ